MPIPIIFSPSFPTWGFHNHFVKIKYTIGGPSRGNVVYLSSPSLSSPYNNNPPYLCFPFIGWKYTYNKFYIKCGSCFS
jgi:hypothetical protein